MRAIIIAASVLLLAAAPAFAGKHDSTPHPSAAAAQDALDKTRAAPVGPPGISQATKNHIINTILRICPTCS